MKYDLDLEGRAEKAQDFVLRVLIGELGGPGYTRERAQAQAKKCFYPVYILIQLSLKLLEEDFDYCEAGVIWEALEVHRNSKPAKEVRAAFVSFVI